ncbi:uncharacterized protein LOC130804434 [Amaranthus tricolor]|uniref:uncharacterized protein LOC130804434 n=1 Tax=Amaranthus tricolor TaxID=29722 RepID=UPI002586B438|nr:uncharacterized protein LOC130804434 [Amaranthus tricolor]
MGWKEKEATGEFTPKGNVDALHMVLGKDHSGRVVGKGGVRVGLQKAFGKECVATQSRTALREEAATLRAEITKDVLAKRMEGLNQVKNSPHFSFLFPPQQPSPVASLLPPYKGFPPVLAPQNAPLPS